MLLIWYEALNGCWNVHLIPKGFTLTTYSVNSFCSWFRKGWDIHSSSHPLSSRPLDRVRPLMKVDLALLRRPQSDSRGPDSFCPLQSLWPELWRRSAQLAGSNCWGSWRDTWENTQTLRENIPRDSSSDCFIPQIYATKGQLATITCTLFVQNIILMSLSSLLFLTESLEFVGNSYWILWLDQFGKTFGKTCCKMLRYLNKNQEPMSQRISSCLKEQHVFSVRISLFLCFH